MSAVCNATAKYAEELLYEACMNWAVKLCKFDSHPSEPAKYMGSYTDLGTIKRRGNTYASKADNNY